MSNVKDTRYRKDWPCTIVKVLPKHVVVKMAGQNGFNEVTQGNTGPGSVQDTNIQVVFEVSLPGLNSTVGTLEVTFNRR
ncbi:hypothetical protein D3C87_370730 [compost metagenome]